jgi:hypothetical protein
MHKFIVTHKPLEWEIPFEHRLVTVNGYKQDGAIDATDFIGELNLNRTFAFYGGIAAVLENIKNLSDDDTIAVYGYRCYFGTSFKSDLDFHCLENCGNIDNEEKGLRKLITPDELYKSWENDVMVDFPDGCDVVIMRPTDLKISVLQQHALYHHVDDLMYATAIAIRSGLFGNKITAAVFSNSIFISAFASKVGFFRNLYERIWWIAKEFYKNHYIPRDGYNVRGINYLLERIVCIYLIQKIYVEQTPTLSTNQIVIDKNKIYTPTL